ncbi:LAGLIDADG family homing endonuclease [Actinacidiphila sp. ITFR-21]|uniref:LAGLIDADG family homing endonuclease n=1 Tax=Actinacidiphila sp. ITFR-21 TaxID=3075199 RepID=UPI00288985C7|nr:LAGLIDADG family homing endonuclease [Streptomyces sp. ITFR-21]WNI19144.1 LAGLIDADG family homing endonuclease [Streptomyces sp. ITFR-21]
MPEPQRLGGENVMRRIQALLEARGLANVERGPVDNTPSPDEPGHPDYHHRQRVDIAVNRWRTAAPFRYQNATATHPEIEAWADHAAKDRRSAGFLVLTGTFGTGKALRDSEELATPDGPRAIGSIHVGDSVFGGDGAPCRVVGVYPQGTRSLWRMHLRDGRSVVCDAEHLWPVHRISDRSVGTPAKVMSLAEMMNIGLTYPSGVARWYIPAPGPVQYPARDLPIDPYTLGVLIGDGGLTSTTPNVTTPDPEILDLIKLPVGVTPRVRPRQRDSKALTYLLSGRRPRPNPLTVALRDLGLMGLRSSQRFLPDTYLSASLEDRFALLAGLVDTDGYIKGASISISTSSERLASDIRNLVWSLGGNATARRKETTHLPSWTVHLALPAHMSCPARLARRLNAWAPRRDGRGSVVAVTGVERVPDGNATCIAVDSQDHTYLTADYVRTHNTHQAYGALRRIAESGPDRFEMIAMTAPDMYGLLRPGGSDRGAEAELKRLCKIPLLLLDDLGTEKISEWTEEATYRLLNDRYNECRPLIVTSNFPTRSDVGEDLSDRLGGRIASRLSELTTVVVLEGPDLRRQHRSIA